MFVAPLAVAIVSGVVLLMLDQEPEPEILPATAQLEVVDMSVGGGGGEPDDLPYIDIRVRNTGDTVSVVTGATLEIRAQGVIDICEGGGAPLEQSAEYDVVMPPMAAGQQRTVEADVSQQIGPHEADRFSIRLTIPDTEFFWHPHLYQVDVRLSHDSGDARIYAGTAIVAVPLVPSWAYFTPEMAGPIDESIAACYRENVRLLNQFLDMDGVKPSELTSDLLLGRAGEIPTAAPLSSAAAESPAGSSRAPAAVSPVLASPLTDFETYLSESGLSCEPFSEEVTYCESGEYSVNLIADDATPGAADQIIAIFDQPSAAPPIIFEGLALLATRDTPAATWVREAQLPPEGELMGQFGDVHMLLYGSPDEFWGLHVATVSP